ncbi:hypothetical protein QQF64_023216 [Cirrhinus molitorella]|uniref:Uncharacterized protein n=1 Tax=Cirrhinus molitorella TaxID=172907 RepID=A0ABR3L650_9TELE
MQTNCKNLIGTSTQEPTLKQGHDIWGKDLRDFNQELIHGSSPQRAKPRVHAQFQLPLWRQQNPHTPPSQPWHPGQRFQPRAHPWFQLCSSAYGPRPQTSHLGQRAQRANPRVHAQFQPPLWRQQNHYGLDHNHHIMPLRRHKRAY